jgi:hypothetical protein
MVRPAAVELSTEERKELTLLGRLPTGQTRVAQRARIVLLAADGLSNTAIAATLQVSRPTVIEWRKRFTTYGVDGLTSHPWSRAPQDGHPDVAITTADSATDRQTWSSFTFTGAQDAGAALPDLLTGVAGKAASTALLELLWPSASDLDTLDAMTAFRVRPTTIARWRRDGLSGPRARQLAALLSPPPETLLEEHRRERLARDIRDHLALNRRLPPEHRVHPGQRLPHGVYLAHLDGTPLDCVVISRGDTQRVNQAERGVTADGNNFYRAQNWWHAQLIRYAILALPQHAHARIEVPAFVANTAHTSTWLAQETSISESDWLAIAAHTAAPSKWD